MASWMLARSGAGIMHKTVKVSRNEGVAYTIEKTILFSKPRAGVDVSITNKSSFVASAMGSLSKASGFVSARSVAEGNCSLESKAGNFYGIDPYEGQAGVILPKSNKYNRGNGGVSTGIVSSVKTPLYYNIESVSVQRIFQPQSVSNKSDSVGDENTDGS